MWQDRRGGRDWVNSTTGAGYVVTSLCLGLPNSASPNAEGGQAYLIDADSREVGRILILWYICIYIDASIAMVEILY